MTTSTAEAYSGTEAYANGYKAYFNGIPVMANPYGSMTQEYSCLEWSCGWHYAQAVDNGERIPLRF